MSNVDKILSSKIEIPTVYSNIVQRSEMVESIRNTEKKVIVLNAGAGAGKTMLMLLFAKSYEDQCAWYSISSIDNDIMVFMNYLTKSIQRVVPDFQFNPIDYLDNPQEAYMSPDKLAICYAKELSESIKSDFYVILDDFQEIVSENIVQVISYMIQYTPPHIKAVISVKGAFPKFLAKYLIQDMVQRYTAEQLAFTRQEITNLLNENCYYARSDTVGDKIFEVTQGWPAGVMFTLLVIKQQGSRFLPEDVPDICMQQTVYDYIMYEIFRKLPFDIQKFLTQTSTLNILSVDICNAVMEISNSKSILDYLVQEDLFTLRVSIKENVYRYHSIFRSFLQSQLDVAGRQEVLEKAAYYCLQRSDKGQAAEYGMILDNEEVVEKAVGQIGIELIEKGQTEKLKGWICYLLQKEKKLSAECEYVIARYNRFLKQYENALIHIEKAENGFLREKREKEYVQAIYEHSILLRRENDLQKAYDLIIKTLNRGVKEIVSQFLILFYYFEISVLYNKISQADQLAVKIQKKGIWDKHLPRLGKYMHVVNVYIRNRGYIQNIIYSSGELSEIELIGETSMVVCDYLSWNYFYYAYINKKTQLLQDSMAMRARISTEGNVYSEMIEFLMGLCGERNNILVYKKKYDAMCVSLQNCCMEIPKLLKDDEEALHILQTEGEKVLHNEVKYINVYCFGGFQLKIANERIKWRTKKSMELFAYLYDKQGVLVSKEVIAEALWPEVDPDKGSNLFHTTLSYVRKALKDMHHVIISVNKQYGLNMKLVKSDCRILLQIFDNIKKSNFELFDRKESMLGLYKGAYMQGLEYSWADGKSEYYEHIFLRCCEELAGYERKQNRLEQVIYCLREAEKIDPYSEKDLLILMDCFYQLGDYRQLKSTYEKAKALYSNDLGLELSDTVNELYQRCIGKESGTYEK